MGKRPLLGAFCVGCAVLLNTASWAATSATVDPSKGVVLVNRGQGFNQIKQPAKLKVGNSVMVGPDGAAVIAYADGCTVDVKPGTVETVAQLSPCASGASAQNQDYSYHWCATPGAPTDYGNPSYCAGVPITAAVLAVFGGIVYDAISP